MTLKNLFLILSREYRVRLRKPSFWVLTVLVPLVLAVLYALPVAAHRSAERTTVLVVDETGLFANGLQSTLEVGFKPMPSLDYARKQASKHDLVLFVPMRETTIPRDAFLYYRGDSPTTQVQSLIDGQLQTCCATPFWKTSTSWSPRSTTRWRVPTYGCTPRTPPPATRASAV